MTLKLLTSRYCYNMIDTSFSILVVPGAVPRYDIILISTILHCKRYNTVQLQMKIYVLFKNSCLFLHATSCKKRLFIFDVRLHFVKCVMRQRTHVIS